MWVYLKKHVEQKVFKIMCTIRAHHKKGSSHQIEQIVFICICPL